VIAPTLYRIVVSGPFFVNLKNQGRTYSRKKRRKNQIFGQNNRFSVLNELFSIDWYKNELGAHFLHTLNTLLSPQLRRTNGPKKYMTYEPMDTKSTWKQSLNLVHSPSFFRSRQTRVLVVWATKTPVFTTNHI
jgi:hypothetical protein